MKIKKLLSKIKEMNYEITYVHNKKELEKI